MLRITKSTQNILLQQKNTCRHVESNDDKYKLWWRSGNS